MTRVVAVSSVSCKEVGFLQGTGVWCTGEATSKPDRSIDKDDVPWIFSSSHLRTRVCVCLVRACGTAAGVGNSPKVRDGLLGLAINE